MRRAARFFLILIFVSCFGAPIFVPYDPFETAPDQQLQRPSRNHILGTDLLGRDVFSRLLYGGQRTLMVSVIASGLVFVCGTVVAFVASLGTRWIDETIGLFVNALLAFPNLLLTLLVLTLVGRSVPAIILALGLGYVAAFVRVARSIMLGAKSGPHIEGARSLGATEWHILRQHVLPFALTGVINYTVVVFSYVLMSNATLGYLGLAAEPGVPEWGAMIQEGRLVFLSAPWLSVPPGLLISGVVISAMFLARVNGDA